MEAFSRYWPFVRGIHRLSVNSPHKGQQRGALMFSLICAWTNSWANNGDAGDLRRHRAHYDVIVIKHVVIVIAIVIVIIIAIVINLAYLIYIRILFSAFLRQQLEK